VDQLDQVAVSGRVRTADGASIGGAAVTLADLSGRQAAVARADAAGQYRLAAPGAGSYLLIVSAPGQQPAASTLIVESTAVGNVESTAVGNTAVGSTEVRHDVVLRGGSGVTGTVRASSGQPVSGATVTVADGRGEIAGATTTGTDGLFRLGQLTEGQYTLVVAATPYAPVAVQVAVEDGELARRDVQLPASGRVAGTVLTADGDRPFARAQLSLVNEAGTEVATAAADTGGQFAFDDVPSGRYTLVANGYRPGVAALPAASTRTRQADITLARPE
jgi:Carboxypeptidase regulatory-like domain